MALKLKLNKAEWEALGEGIKGLYEEKDDGYVLSIDGLEDTTGLKNTVAATRKERDDLAKQLKSWEKTGKTPDEISELLAGLEDQAKKKAEQDNDIPALKKQYEEQLARVVKQHEEKLKSMEDRLKVAEDSEKTSVIENKLMTALSDATTEGMDFLPERLSRRIKYETQDGKRIFKILTDDTGETPMIGSGPDGMATFKDLVDESKKRWPSLFKATGTSGGDSGGAKGSGASAGGKKKSEMTREEKVDFISKHGAEEFEKLPV